MWCAQSREPEEMAHCLQHTQQESGFIVTGDTKCVAFPWTSTQHMFPCTSMWLWGRTSETGLNFGRKSTVFSGEAWYLESVQSTRGWAMINLIKSYEEPLFSRRNKERKRDFNYMPFWKRQNCGDNKKISDCQKIKINGETCTKALSQGPSQAFQAPVMVSSERGSEGPGKAPRPRPGRAPRQSPSFCHRASPPHLH